MKALYLHGFLGSVEDMKPLFLEGVDCESVDIKEYLGDPLKLMNHFKGSYDFAVAYSYGGRLLAKCLELDSHFIKQPVFCSSRITEYTGEELLERQKFQSKLLSFLESSEKDFYNYWDSLSLFSGHKMSSYREEFKINVKSWSKSEILNFLKEHFTYNTPDLNLFEERSVYFYGEEDLKYKALGEKLNMKCHGFDSLGHRFLFEDPDVFKKALAFEVLK